MHGVYPRDGMRGLPWSRETCNCYQWNDRRSPEDEQSEDEDRQTDPESGKSNPLFALPDFQEHRCLYERRHANEMYHSNVNGRGWG
jgi:hypothetical protein